MSDPGRLGIEMSGGCQCGAVRFHVSELMANPHLCYCRMCQKATGGLFAAAVGAHDLHLTWTRGTPATFASSDYVERGFCANCGTPLFFHYRGAPYRTLSIAAFDDPHRIPIYFQIGTEGRHPALLHLNEIRDDGVTEDVDPGGVAKIRRTNHQHPDHDTAVWPLSGDFPR